MWGMPKVSRRMVTWRARVSAFGADVNAGVINSISPRTSSATIALILTQYYAGLGNVSTRAVAIEGMRMSLLAKTMLGVALAAAVVQTAPDNAGIQPKIAFAEPGISPDGKQIAFVSGGDIWDVPAGGGEARLLVSHPAAESRPLYSPDGRQLAFVSTRTGNGDIYVLTLDTGELRRVTFDDAAETLNGWTPDSKAVLFSSVSQDVS